MKKEQRMVISVMDQDRPGIVAEVTEGISQLGGNLTDLREQVLSGWFTMILLAGFPESVSVAQVEQALADATDSKVSVSVADGSVVAEQPSEMKYVLTAVAEDRVGLVASVSRFCSNKGVNIVDLTSHVDADQYTMMLLVDLASVESIPAFRKELTAFGGESGLDLTLRHNDIFRATNEV